MNLREAAEMALEALKEVNKLSVGEIAVCLPAEIDDAMEALRQALAQQKKEWVGLTDEERRGIREWQEIQKELGPVWAPMMLYLYDAIEFKLKEKNT